MADTETAIAVRNGPGLDVTAYEPRNLVQAHLMARILANSGLLGKVPPKPEAVLFLMARGRELGFSTAQSIDAFHIMDGKPSLSAQAKVALCKRRPDVCVYIRFVEGDANSATWETQRVGDPEPTRFTYTIEDAKTMGLLDRREGAGPGSWQRQPATMLRWRAATTLIGMVYPDLVLGLYDPEERREIAAAEGREVIEGTFTIAPEQVDSAVAAASETFGTEPDPIHDEAGEDAALRDLADHPTADPVPGKDRAYQNGDACAVAGCKGKYRPARGGPRAGLLQCTGKIGGQWANHPAPTFTGGEPAARNGQERAAPEEPEPPGSAAPIRPDVLNSIRGLFVKLHEAKPEGARWRVVGKRGWRSGVSLNAWLDSLDEGDLLNVYDDLVALRDAQEIPV